MGRLVADPICQSVSRSVSVRVRKVYSSKTADWIRMPFVTVRGLAEGRVY